MNNSFPNLGFVSGAVPQTQGSAPFVGALDGYTSGLAAALSVCRRLMTAYTGKLIRVRRSSDDAEQDVGATAAGLLDTASLLSFVGAGSAYLRKIYDQSGAGADAGISTATLQPQIVASGAVNLLTTGVPAAVFDGTNDYLQVPGVLTNDVRAFSTMFKSPTATWGYYGAVVGPSIDNGTMTRLGLFAGSTTGWHSDPYPVGVRKNGATLSSPFDLTTINAAMVMGMDTAIASVYPTDAISIGSSGNAAGGIQQYYLSCLISEVVVWNSTANRAGFEANQKTFLGL